MLFFRLLIKNSYKPDSQEPGYFFVMAIVLKPIGNEFHIIDMTTKKVIKIFNKLEDGMKYCHSLVNGIISR